MNRSSWTYPPTDAEFHESFYDFKAAHFSSILPDVVITTTIVDTDYSHGPQRPAERHRGTLIGRRWASARWLSATLDLRKASNLETRRDACRPIAWLAVCSCAPRMQCTDWHIEVHANWQQTTAGSSVTNQPRRNNEHCHYRGVLPRATFLGALCCLPGNLFTWSRGLKIIRLLYYFFFYYMQTMSEDWQKGRIMFSLVDKGF